MKYIILQDTDQKEYAFTFPECINHDDFAEMMVFLIMKSFKKPSMAESAGFASCHCYCSGESETLGIKSRKEDSMVLSFGEVFSQMRVEDLPESFVKEMKKRLVGVEAYGKD